MYKNIMESRETSVWEERKLNRRGAIQGIATFFSGIYLQSITGCSPIEKQEKIDYQKIWPNNIPVLCIGENHSTKFEELHMLRSLNTFQKMGVTHLALEIPCDFQETIEQYKNGKIQKDDMHKRLNKVLDGPFGNEETMEILDKVLELKNIKIVCADAEEEFVRKYGGPFSPSLGKRNTIWAHNIANIIKERKDARVIVRGGKRHFGYNSYEPHFVNQFLRSEGFESVVAQYTISEKTKHRKDELRTYDWMLNVSD